MNKYEMEELLNVLSELSKVYELEENDFEKFYQKFKKIYSDKEFRHSYAVLSDFARHMYPDSRAELSGKLDSIIIYSEQNYNSDDVDKTIRKGIDKLADHIELESLRLDRMAQIEAISDNVIKECNNAKKIIGENQDVIESQSQQIKNMNAQLVSVLGIFSAVVIAFFGGLSYFTSAFANLSDMPLYKSLMLSSILGLVIFNTVYLLLKFILKIIREDKRKFDTSNVVWIINSLLIASLVFSIIMWFTGFCPASENYSDSVSDSSSSAYSSSSSAYVEEQNNSNT